MVCGNCLSLPEDRYRITYWQANATFFKEFDGLARKHVEDAVLGASIDAVNKYNIDQREGANRRVLHALLRYGLDLVCVVVGNNAQFDSTLGWLALILLSIAGCLADVVLNLYRNYNAEDSVNRGLKRIATRLSI